MKELPPRVPEELAELGATVQLLGNRSKTDLGPKPRARLLALIGCYPDPKAAAYWKIALKGLRQEMVELGE